MANSIRPTSASFLMTEDCNLRCTYCFEKHKKNKMSKEVGVKAVEWLVDNAIYNHDNSIHVMFFGGEPLLNIDTIEEILEKGTELCRKRNLQFTASMVTNATVMNDRIYNVIKKYRDIANFNIQLSVDGIPEIHDFYRLTAAGKGSFSMVEKNIPIFQELYGNDPNDKRLSIHGCLNKKSLPYLYDSYSFFRKELGFKQIWFLPIVEEEWEQSDIEIYREANEKIFKDCIADVEATGDISDSYNYAPISKYCNLERGRADKPCGAGYNFVTITAAGDVYPCHQIYFNDPDMSSKLGTIFDEELDYDKRRMFIEYDNSDIEGCANCNNSQCYRCIAANWTHKGSLFSQMKKLYCGFMSIDNEFQHRMKQYIESHFSAQGQDSCSCCGEESAAECLCNCRECQTPTGECDIVHNQEFCQSGNNPDNPDCLCNVNNENQCTNDSEDRLVLLESKMNVLEAKLDILLSKIDNAN